MNPKTLDQFDSLYQMTAGGWYDVEDDTATPTVQNTSAGCTKGTVTTPSSSSHVLTTTTGYSPTWQTFLDPVMTQAEHNLKQVLDHIDYIQLPSDLDLRNETVQSAVADWYEALEQLKLKHQQLKMLINLTKTHE